MKLWPTGRTTAKIFFVAWLAFAIFATFQIFLTDSSSFPGDWLSAGIIWFFTFVIYFLVARDGSLVRIDNINFIADSEIEVVEEQEGFGENEDGQSLDPVGSPVSGRSEALELDFNQYECPRCHTMFRASGFCVSCLLEGAGSQELKVKQ